MSTETLERLWELADRLAAEQPGREDMGYAVFEPVGLVLERPPVPYHYEETPCNSTCFAHAGPSGVHFNLLHVDGQASEESPIVMTVPGTAKPNLVVGASLAEFLRLGCRSGFGGLDGLVDALDETIGRIEAADENFEDFDDESQELLDALCMEFGIFPWHDIEARLGELQREFGGMLQA